MSLAQLVINSSLGVPAPKLKLDQSSGRVLNASGPFTMMVWAYHTGGTGDAYHDIMSVRDSSVSGSPGTDQIIGIVSHVVGSVRVCSVGDVDSDADGVQTIPDNEWHHFTWIVEPLPGTLQVRQTAYVDGVQHTRSDGVGMTTALFPNPSCWAVLFNSRSSDTDGGGVFVGMMAGLKIWEETVLSVAEIQREMWSYMAAKQSGLFACLPMLELGSAGQDITGGTTWTVQGADFTTGVLNPPGVQWAPTQSYRDVSTFYNPASATLDGDALDNITEEDIRAGGKVITITLNGASWIS